MKSSIRVAGIAISPPTAKISGGVSAGIQLMSHVANLKETHMLVMADQNYAATVGKLEVSYVRATNSLSWCAGVLPRAIETLWWRAPVGKWLDKVMPDVVHLHNPHPPGAFLAAARACRKRRIPYVISTHGFVEFDDYQKAFGAPSWQKPLLDLLIRRPVVKTATNAAAVLMLSPQEEPILISMGVEREKLGIATNGVDPYFCTEISADSRQSLTSRFEIPENRLKILFVGNHTANKGIDVLLTAAKMLRGDTVVIVAGAIRSQKEHQLLLRDSGTDTSLGQVIFTDVTTKEELRALYQSADIFCFPSRADTLPLVILEAMVSGLPVVSTKTGGIPYEVSADTGILVDSGDALSLANALNTLHDDKHRRARLGEAGRARAIQLFDWAGSAKKAVQVYDQLLLSSANA